MVSEATPPRVPVAQGEGEAAQGLGDVRRVGQEVPERDVDRPGPGRDQSLGLDAAAARRGIRGGQEVVVSGGRGRGREPEQDQCEGRDGPGGLAGHRRRDPGFEWGQKPRRNPGSSRRSVKSSAINPRQAGDDVDSRAHVEESFRPRTPGSGVRARFCGPRAGGRPTPPEVRGRRGVRFDRRGRGLLGTFDLHDLLYRPRIRIVGTQWPTKLAACFCPSRRRARERPIEPMARLRYVPEGTWLV